MPTIPPICYRKEYIKVLLEVFCYFCPCATEVGQNAEITWQTASYHKQFRAVSCWHATPCSAQLQKKRDILMDDHKPFLFILKGHILSNSSQFGHIRHYHIK